MFKKYEELRENYKKNLKKLKKKYKKLKIKYFLLFVLPVFLVTLIFQAVKQLLKIRAREPETAAAEGSVTS